MPLREMGSVDQSQVFRQRLRIETAAPQAGVAVRSQVDDFRSCDPECACSFSCPSTIAPEQAVQFARAIADRLHIIGGDLQQPASALAWPHSCRSGEDDRRYSDARAQSSPPCDNPELENPTERRRGDL